MHNKLIAGFPIKVLTVNLPDQQAINASTVIPDNTQYSLVQIDEFIASFIKNNDIYHYGNLLQRLVNHELICENFDQRKGEYIEKYVEYVQLKSKKKLNINIFFEDPENHSNKALAGSKKLKATENLYKTRNATPSENRVKEDYFSDKQPVAFLTLYETLEKYRELARLKHTRFFSQEIFILPSTIDVCSLAINKKRLCIGDELFLSDNTSQLLKAVEHELWHFFDKDLAQGNRFLQLLSREERQTLDSFLQDYNLLDKYARTSHTATGLPPDFFPRAMKGPVDKSVVLENVPSIETTLSVYFEDDAPNAQKLTFRSDIANIIRRSPISKADKDELFALLHQSIYGVSVFSFPDFYDNDNQTLPNLEKNWNIFKQNLSLPDLPEYIHKGFPPSLINKIDLIMHKFIFFAQNINVEIIDSRDYFLYDSSETIAQIGATRAIGEPLSPHYLLPVSRGTEQLMKKIGMPAANTYFLLGKESEVGRDNLKRDTEILKLLDEQTKLDGSKRFSVSDIHKIYIACNIKPEDLSKLLAIENFDAFDIAMLLNKPGLDIDDLAANKAFVSQFSNLKSQNEDAKFRSPDLIYFIAQKRTVDNVNGLALLFDPKYKLDDYNIRHLFEIYGSDADNFDFMKIILDRFCDNLDGMDYTLRENTFNNLKKFLIKPEDDQQTRDLKFERKASRLLKWGLP